MKNKVKRITSLLLAMIMVFGTLPLINASAVNIVSNGKCGEALTWTLDDMGTLTISGQGAMTDFYAYYEDEGEIAMYCSEDDGEYYDEDWEWDYEDVLYTNIPWHDKYVNSVVIKDGVTTIGNYAFFACYDLINVSIPDSVTSIGVSAFLDCTDFSDINIPDGVTRIGKNAFTHTAYFDNSANWANNVLYIGKHLIYADRALLGAYTINDGTINIADGAFGSYSKNDFDYFYYVDYNYTYYNESCTKLTSVTIPDSVANIGSEAFYNCNSLESIVLPEGLTNINELTFYNCSSLNDITIPDNVVRIGSDAFKNTAYSTSSKMNNATTKTYANTKTTSRKYQT